MLKWVVVDNDFNRANYADLIGQKFDNPPGYAAVRLVLDRKYIARGRNGYMGIDEFVDNQCLRTVTAGIKPQKLGREIADLLNMAYHQGKEDRDKEIEEQNRRAQQ